MIRRLFDLSDRLLRALFPFLKKVPSLEQFLKFCIVGASGLVVDMLAMLAAVDGLGIDPRIAVIPAFAIAATTNYLLNRAWTFTGTTARVGSSYVAFIGVCAAGAGLRVAVMHVLLFVPFFAEGHGYLAANLVGILVATVFNFLGSKYLAFGRR